MRITCAEAKELTDAYINSRGGVKHCKIKGNAITGYIFTRKELSSLLNEGKNHLFLMWGLSPKDVEHDKRYLNLIIGAVSKTEKEGQDTEYKLNTVGEKPFLKTSFPIYITPIPIDKNEDNSSHKSGYFEKLALSDTIFFIKSIADTIDRESLKKGIADHVEALKNSNNSIFNLDETNEKVKAYHLGEKSEDRYYLQDLKELTLWKPPTTAKDEDQFIFMPLIRSKDPNGTRLKKPYLSVAISQFKAGTLEGEAMEYCLPCPSACPTNYPLKLSTC